MTDTAISPLRQRMIEDMIVRGFLLRLKTDCHHPARNHDQILLRRILFCTETADC